MPSAVVAPITGISQHYAWGDPEAIPGILGVEADGRPWAEWWLGAHPKAPALLPDGSTLDDRIAGAPTEWLGGAVDERFGRLPFLLKILAAGVPLSIQSHPSLDEARAGFARENAEGVPLDAPHRTYRDDNHKPELICALTPFEAKCGYRTPSSARAVVDRLRAATPHPDLDLLAEHLAADGADADVLAATTAWVLDPERSDAPDLVPAVVEAAAATATDAAEDVELRWCAEIDAAFPADPGLVVGLLLNHISLQPGQAIFLEAGNLHAYLRGVGVELMANSDNVIRGGLTPKHIDLAELASVVDATPLDAAVQTSAAGDHTFDIPVPEFGLRRLSGEVSTTVEGPAIALVISGSATVGDAEIGPGASAMVGAGTADVRSNGEVYLATVGQLD